jgi:hypothetical protein
MPSRIPATLVVFTPTKALEVSFVDNFGSSVKN